MFRLIPPCDSFITKSDIASWNSKHQSLRTEKKEKEMRLFKHWPLMLPISLLFDAYTFTMMWQGDCEASYRIGLSKMSYISNLNPIESCLLRDGQIYLNFTLCIWVLHDTQHLTDSCCNVFLCMLFQFFCNDKQKLILVEYFQTADYWFNHLYIFVCFCFL